MEAVREWSTAIVMLVAAGAFVEMALPEGNTRKYVSFIFSLMILDMFLEPLASACGSQL